ncbi:hypothetical protein [Paenibacillus donghaensis]|uniref:Uncharacterized protein n=1 Tax=Paenibacillus donghaensis TaxID=414771 RepID=A0A2Z2KHE3_9BACL|nr:hypothetical protein [Paenibacillus donghaensis]ASA25664.1 hypothetical protein B9T62_36000 [Paenibacillus donghaensis]
MSNKTFVINELSKRYNCTLSTIQGKQIMYQAISGGKSIVICTPYSKLHVSSKGWFDLTTKQIELLDDSHIAVLAVRLGVNKIYYIDFKELRKMMNPEIMLRNPNEGEHWKLFVWEDHIKVQGNEQKFMVQPVAVH